MAKRSRPPTSDADLRRHAEARLHGARNSPQRDKASSADSADCQRLMHELRVLRGELDRKESELIDARVQTETALARYTELYDVSPIAHFTLDPRGEILQTNLTGALLLGQPRPQVTGRQFGTFVLAASAPAFDAFLAGVFQQNGKGAAEVTLDLAADSPRSVRVKAIASEDRQACHAMVADVTEHSRALDALRSFSRVIEQTASAVVITDSEGTIEYVNPRFCESSGYTADEAIGRRPNLLKSGRTPEEQYRELWRTITGGSTWRGEFCNRRKDGSLYWESAIISPVRDERGVVTHFAGIQDDISEAKRGEVALRASESRFRHLFDLAPVPLCFVSRDGVLVDFNRRFVETFGYTLEDLPTLNEWWQLAFPDTEYRRQAMVAWDTAVQRATEAGTDIEPVDYLVMCKNGEVRTLVMTGRILGDRMFTTFFDITERKRAEQALAERAAEQRAVIETTSDGFAIVDERGRILEVNDAYARRSGYSREELLTMTVWQLEAKEAPEDVRKRMDQLRRTGSELFESVHRTKNGELWPAEVNAAYWASAGGRYFVFLRDITERKRAGLALAQREAQNRAVIETTADGFWMLDREGMLLQVNDAYVRRCGYSREELLTMHISQLDANETAEEVRGHIETVLRHGSDLFETRHRTKDGQLWPVEVTAAYWASAGGRFFVFVRDISERKRNEAAIRALHLEMEHRNRAHIASQTVAALAHELNQPLLAVAAYAEAALRLLRAGNPTPDKLCHALENSNLQAQRAGEVVRDLMNALRDSDGEFDAVGINDLVSDAIAIVRRNAGVSFQAVLDLATDLAPVRANRLRIAKVLENLIQNGVEAMRDAGVSPSLLTIAARTAADGRMAHITVSDSGPGLDTQTLHRIFDPFFSTKANGLGMGLPISRSIIEAHGGQLWVESDPGMGASFHFTLPFAQ